MEKYYINSFGLFKTDASQLRPNQSSDGARSLNISVQIILKMFLKSVNNLWPPSFNAIYPIRYWFFHIMFAKDKHYLP